MMKAIVNPSFELSSTSRKWAYAFLIAQLLFLVLVCFLPQSVYPQLKGSETPGIVHIGRLVFLPLPFNALIQLGKIPNISDLTVILLQNISNVFLIYPLVLALLFLFKEWRSTKKVVWYGFLISLTIELTQLLLDFFFDFNRVFETDDLITNTLGAYLAYLTYQKLKALHQRTIIKE